MHVFSRKTCWSYCENIARVMDYRCENGPFPVTASCVTIPKSDSLSSCETVVNPGMKSWKKPLSDWARCQKAIGDIYFTKKWRAETPQHGLLFDNLKPRVKVVSSNASPDWKVLFLGVMIGVLWEAVKTYLMPRMSSLGSPIFFPVFASIVYDSFPVSTCDELPMIRVETHLWRCCVSFRRVTRLRYHLTWCCPMTRLRRDGNSSRFDIRSSRVPTAAVTRGISLFLSISLFYLFIFFLTLFVEVPWLIHVCRGWTCSNWQVFVVIFHFRRVPVF